MLANIAVLQVPGGVAETSGQLLQGDQIISVNSLDLEKATQVSTFIKKTLATKLSRNS
jgi:hypothetical protein